MSQFTEFTSVRIPTKYCPLFETTEDLIYERYYEGSGKFIVVPKGFKTDFASIPWILQFAVKPYDPRWILGAILHDYLWSIAKTLEDYQKANDIFYECIMVTGTPKYLAIPAFSSVTLSKYGYWACQKIYP